MAWVASQSACEAALRSNPRVIEGVAAVAESLRAEAVGLARARAYESGVYIAGLRVIDGPGPVKAVVATAPHSWFVEAGTGIHGPLRRPVSAHATTASGRFKFTVMDAGRPRVVVVEEQQGRPARWVMRDAAHNIAGLAGVTFRPVPV